jgi:hypothetical protein
MIVAITLIRKTFLELILGVLSLGTKLALPLLLQKKERILKSLLFMMLSICFLWKLLVSSCFVYRLNEDTIFESLILKS